MDNNINSLNNPMTFTAAQASALVRFFSALERQIEQEFQCRDIDTARGLCRIAGGLHYQVFGVTKYTPESFGKGL